MIHVVVGLLFNAEGEVLVAERQHHKFQGGRWEFPGGKVELNESPLHALQREFQEEIGIDILIAESWEQLTHTYPDKIILLDVWRIIKFHGEPHGKEGQPIRWVSLNDLLAIDIPDANSPIVQKLLL